MSKAFSDVKRGLLCIDQLTFGKYEGAFIEDILSTDPSYIAWIYLNTSVKFDETVKRKLVAALLDTPKQKTNLVPKDMFLWQETSHWDDVPY
jgi:hypothetical protein